MAILKGENLEVKFGGLIAVTNFSFKTKESEILSIIGPNGAGKTTLFNTLTGFIKPTKGKILLDENDITTYPPYKITKLGIARTFQKRSFFPSLSVLENILLGCHLQNTTSFWTTILKSSWKKEEQNRVFAKELLDLVGLQGKEDIEADILPYGEQRLLGIAIALASRPKILLLDEPCAGSNPAESKKIVQLIKDIRDSGISIILVEHHMRVVMSISDRIIVLNSGEKLAEGTSDEIQKNMRVIEAYLGRKSQNGSVA